MVNHYCMANRGECEMKDKKVPYYTARKKKDEKDKYYKVAALIGFFAVWEIFGRLNYNFGWIETKFLPMPSEIIMSAYNFICDGTLLKHLQISIYRVLSGYFIGVIVAVIIGALIANFKAIDNIVTPILNLFGPIPVMAFLPMFILWFGIGEASKIILIAYATVIYMVTYVVEGIKNTDPLLIRSAMSMGANKIQLFWNVKFKSAFPNVFVGMKGALGTAFGAMVVAEMLGASTGLGYIIVFSKNWFRMADMMLAAMLIGLLYTVMFAIMSFIEKKLFKWKIKVAGNAIEK